MFVQVQSRWNLAGSFEVTSLFLPRQTTPTARHTEGIKRSRWKVGKQETSHFKRIWINPSPLIYTSLFDQLFFFFLFFFFLNYFYLSTISITQQSGNCCSFNFDLYRLDYILFLYDKK